MTRLIYVLRFEGQAGPAGQAEGELKVSTSAPGCTIDTRLGANGLESELRPLPGATAHFESEVRLTSESDFIESGTIDLGGGSRLLFSTVGAGHIGPSIEAGVMAGSVSWRIDGGEGALAGASGNITSNFLVTPEGTVTDYQLGLIFLP